MPRPRLFISYSHQPEEHSTAVSDFIASVATSDSVELRHDGEGLPPQGPPEGWTGWMRDQIEKADWILVVCNEPYLKSWQKDPEAGRGVAYEAALLRQALYDNRMVNRKLIPVVVKDRDKAFIPVELRDSTCYMIPRDKGELLSSILKSTWLGRFIGSLERCEEPDKETLVAPPLSATDVISDAEAFDELEKDLPALKDLAIALKNQVNEFIGYLATDPSALDLERERDELRRSFCPRARELFLLTDKLPPSLERVYEKECAT